MAGLIKMVGQGLKLSGKRVVCIITGAGLKDPDIPVKYAEPFPQVPPDLDVVERTLGWR